MAQVTIDFGIDLGTTNSVISVSRNGEIEVIDNAQQKSTPSMVFIDKKGKMHRGMSVKSQLRRPSTAVDVALEFKRVMGQDSPHSFEAAGRVMSPEELSAEILKELRAAAEHRFVEPPRAAVITIPAMFELPQNEATSRAAKLAGFEHVILLQEPVAAATAYGYQSESDKAYWLVYDFGGGTFDVSIVSVRDGQLAVVKHGGDNYLGGADFDRLIVDQCILPSILSQFDLASMTSSPSDKLNKARLAVLKPIAEEVKMNLSRQDSEEIYREAVFDDDSGTPVDIDLPLTRQAFEDMIRSKVEASIEITKQLMADKGMSEEAFEKVLLVGGTTFIPLVREAVSQIGIPVSLEIDPMTVVSYGAAVFASSQRLPKDLIDAAPVATGGASVILEHELVTKDPTPVVGCKIEINGQPAPTGVTVEIAQTHGDWKSGVLNLESGGMLFANVQMRSDQRQTTFVITVRDAQGNQLACDVESFAITNGISVGKASLPQGLSIGQADGTAICIIEEGTSLPATSNTLRSHFVRPLTVGSDDMLRIPIQSGSEPESEFNLTTGYFELKGSDISTDVPAGTEVEIVAAVDGNNPATVTFTIPLLDETFEVVGLSDLEFDSPVVMKERAASIRSRLSDLRQQAEKSGQHDATRAISEYESSGKLDEIDGRIAASEQGDPVASGQARNLQRGAHKKLRDLEGLVEWPALMAEWKDQVDRLRRLVHDEGDGDERTQLDSIVAEGEKAVTSKDPRMLKRAMEQLGSLGAGIASRNPAFWGAMLRHIAEEEHKLTDRAAGRRLLEEGVAAMRRGDGQSLQSIVRQLWQLLPPEVVQQSQVAASDVRTSI